MMQSDFLFAQPRVVYGWARLLAFFHPFSEYNISCTGQEADARALYCDWVLTANDLRAASTQYESEERATVEGRQGNLFATA